jgi:hypothetical protein
VSVAVKSSIKYLCCVLLFASLTAAKLPYGAKPRTNPKENPVANAAVEEIADQISTRITRGPLETTILTSGVNFPGRVKGRFGIKFTSNLANTKLSATINRETKVVKISLNMGADCRPVICQGDDLDYVNIVRWPNELISRIQTTSRLQGTRQEYYSAPVPGCGGGCTITKSGYRAIPTLSVNLDISEDILRQIANDYPKNKYRLVSFSGDSLKVWILGDNSLYPSQAKALVKVIDDEKRK